MATQSKIARLSGRIDALASRRRRKFRLDDITDEAQQRLRALVADAEYPRSAPMCHLSDEDLIQRLVDLGTLTPADFKASIRANKQIA